ncbi:Bug family tripartite tricarboxylate transporter substrate binding protein [Acidovorax sp. SDU_ACID1]|uniref:Bug family tripartite tricarboxylate transporter substrate binding protein n=1 Tax=Acidovorax sp. SDU_ACID1 TaxID=3136632 RepID=UPI0038730537
MFTFFIQKVLIGTALAISTVGISNASENWPTRPVTLVVPFGAGGITDVTARTVAKLLQEELGQPVVVENKPGASGNIAAGLVARAKPDGYTLMVITNGMAAVNPLINKELNYNALKDFTYISMIANTPLVLVVSEKSPIRDLSALIAQAKQQRENVTFASSGLGTSIHQVLASLQHATDTTFLHVPHKSGAEAANALLSDAVQSTAVETVVVGPFIDSGKMRPLGVTSSQRVPQFSEIPTVEEQLGKEFDVGSISGLVAPTNTPAPVIRRLEDAMAKVLKGEGMKNLFAQGSQPMPVGSEAFQGRMRQEVAKWKDFFGTR